MNSNTRESIIMNAPKIVSASISAMPRPMPEGIGDAMPLVTVKLDNEEVVDLFRYYPDEVNFTEAEFVGLTVAEARDLHRKKDVAFLKS